MIADGAPAIVGVHWFQYSADDEFSTEIGSGDTLVSSLVAQLSASMVGETLTLVAVPEPAGVRMLGLIAMMLVIAQKTGFRLR